MSIPILNSLEIDGNIYLDTKVTASHVDKYIYWGDATDGWDTYIVETADDRLKVFAGGSERLEFQPSAATTFSTYGILGIFL